MLVFDPRVPPLMPAAHAAGLTPTAYVEPIAVGRELPAMPLFLHRAFCVPAPLEATCRQSWAGFPGRWKPLVEGEAGPTSSFSSL